MSTTTNNTTAEQLRQRGEASLELLRGKLIEVMSPAGRKHGILMRRLSWFVENYVEATASGEAYTGDVGFILSRDPDTVLGPDVAYVSQAKLELVNDDDNFLPLVPDVVFEIVSVHDTLKAVAAKAREYLGFGVPLVVVVNPRKHLLHVYRKGENCSEVAEGELFDCGSPAPGLVIDTGRLFRGI